MTPFLSFVKRAAEKIFGEWYEGPNPPERLLAMVEAFAKAYPHATRGEWIGFAAEQAREAYKAGWVRGIEYVERDPDWHPDLPPEIIADMLDPDWRTERGIFLDEELAFVVPEEHDEVEELRGQIEAANRTGKEQRRWRT